MYGRDGFYSVFCFIVLRPRIHERNKQSDQKNGVLIRGSKFQKEGKNKGREREKAKAKFRNMASCFCLI